jgi:1,4-dihydroxy-2-naphthoate octaprenyltransferase
LYLVLVELAVLVLLFAFVLECDDDKTDEYVDHEECNDDNVNKVKYSHNWSVIVDWAVIFGV